LEDGADQNQDDVKIVALFPAIASTEKSRVSLSFRSGHPACGDE
jgi:hypothetical protein